MSHQHEKSYPTNKFWTYDVSHGYSLQKVSFIFNWTLLYDFLVFYAYVNEMLLNSDYVHAIIFQHIIFTELD